MSERFKSVVCVDLLLKRKDGDDTYILLTKRMNTGNDDGYFELPGGHLEANEDLFDAMIRELEEELLITLKSDDLNLVYLLHHYTGDRLNFIFEADGTKLEPRIGEPDKCSEIRWVNIRDLPNETTDKVKDIISDILKNKKYNKM